MKGDERSIKSRWWTMKGDERSIKSRWWTVKGDERTIKLCRRTVKGGGLGIKQGRRTVTGRGLERDPDAAVGGELVWLAIAAVVAAGATDRERQRQAEGGDDVN